MSEKRRYQLGDLSPAAFTEFFLSQSRRRKAKNKKYSVTRIHKFGGTSMERTGEVADIIDSVHRQQGTDIVVVSAVGKTTNKLVDAYREARRANLLGSDDPERIENAMQMVTDVIAVPYLKKAAENGLKSDAKDEASRREFKRLDREIGELSNKLFDEFRTGMFASQDVFLSFGERCSSRLLAAILRSQGVAAEAVDATEIVRTETARGGPPKIDWDETERKSQEILGDLLEQGVVPVVTGFIAKDRIGRTRTLGRGGSDFTASILGETMHAQTVNIWTDVEGVYTKDPNTNPKDARLITLMSHHTADKMAEDGNKVLYEHTMKPVRRRQFGPRATVFVRDTRKPDLPGTRIVSQLTG